MRKRIMSLALMVSLMMLLAVPTALATNTRAITGSPILRIVGTTAICEVAYRSGNRDTEISVTLTLKQGNNTIDSWSSSGKGMVSISETSTVGGGKTYDLILNATVDGKEQPEVSVSAQAA